MVNLTDQFSASRFVVRHDNIVPVHCCRKGFP
jgi:hypothetical protein